MYFRDGEMPTILDILDPIQCFIPAPNSGKTIEELVEDKKKVVEILASALQMAQNMMKNFVDTLLSHQADMNLDPSQVIQPLLLLLLEDILEIEHQIDFEDFKQTVIQMRILEDQLMINQISEVIGDITEFYADKFDDDL